ncbi:MAG: tRNA pseudouridine(38-40) synthase TruA [Mucispirillum sp.]|nr:tRNA pseudouridine(38-40) synthase TruA [Mucispirillum sp.]
MQQQNIYYKACLISYCGDNYNGWQRQKNAVGVQNIIENTLSKLYENKILIAGSGRTDTGVHALGQVFNFAAEKYFDNNTLMRALNSLLPKDIAVLEIADVTKEFHSGKSIKSKTYEYKIINTPIHNPFMINRALWIRNYIDRKYLEDTLSYFCGTYDFQSFCVKKTKKENTIRTVNYIKLISDDENISILINASGFLHNMVRIITGTALKIVKDNLKPETVLHIMEQKDRRMAGPTAPACALYQKEAIYNNDNIPGLKGIPAKYLL